MTDPIKRFLDGKISTGRLLELVTCQHDLVGGFANAIEDLRSNREYLTKKELAFRFGKTVRTIDNWMKTGLIPYYKIGHTVMFKWAEVDRALRKCKVKV